MIGKMIGALVGTKVADHARGVGGPTGAVLGVVAASALRRMSLPVMIALGAGGYFAKKYLDKQSGEGKPPLALEDKSAAKPNPKSKAKPRKTIAA